MNAVLTAEDIDRFVETGYLVARGIVPPDTIAEWLDWCQSRAAGWEQAHGEALQKVVRLAPILKFDVRDVIPAAWEIACQLLGGEERLDDAPEMTDGFIVNSPLAAAEEPPEDAKALWRVPTPESREWHIDGDWFRHFLDSPEWTLTALISWSASLPWAGATLVAPQSHFLVSRYLYEHPEGVDRFNFGILLGKDFAWRQVEMNPGDVLFLHPHLLHCSSQNMSSDRRVISTCMFNSRQPLSLDSARPHSAVERAILRALGTGTVQFARTREASYVKSRRVELYTSSLAAERKALKGMLA